ncbi:LOW QUALITY PROTEIN: pickpocket protein 28-like [Folsomia candida]|uniref:LOW QUALITY PROTEIN: pickpocket protein 28-like n=1 Tax=Folsomia candida TaxID=158441 RepID=UPI001604DABA|nr:LOW QUALITY PROTEIN: pickpocket protein 28-like [Folsomia candida]
MMTILNSKSHQLDLKVTDGVFLKDLDWWEPTSQYCMDSSLHGLRFIGQPKRHLVERIFWIIAFLVSVGFATVLIFQIWDKYRLTPVITVFQPKDTRINLLPFPAITICNTNNVQKSKAEEYEKLVIDNPTNREANHDLYFLNHICESTMTFTDSFNLSLEGGAVRKDLIDHVVKFKTDRNISFGTKAGQRIVHLLRDVTQKCDEMILLCMWGGDVMNCSDLFDEIETDFGYCCVFNMAPMSLLMNLRNDSRDDPTRIEDWKSLNLDTDNMILEEEGSFENEYVQRFGNDRNSRTGNADLGKQRGLSVLLNPDEESYFCTNTDSVGFMALAHLPFDFPNVADKGVPIKPNTETYLKIEPDVVTAGSEIQDFPLENRNCYFGQEFSLKYYKYYTMSNCENECIANITYNECKCIRYYMPRSEEEYICGVKKYNCTETILRDILQEGLQGRCKMCLPSCTDIEFKMRTSFMPIRGDIPLWEYTNRTNASWVGKNVSILHVHYMADNTHPRQRKELYGFIDLVSNTGGLLGLCMGFSVLSILEIIYFLTLRLYCQTRSGRNTGHKASRGIKYAYKKFRQFLGVERSTNVTMFYFQHGKNSIQFLDNPPAGDKLCDVNVPQNQLRIIAKTVDNRFFW